MQKNCRNTTKYQVKVKENGVVLTKGLADAIRDLVHMT